MKGSRSNLILEKILGKIELPEEAYEKAEKRYKDIGIWFHRTGSRCVSFRPHVFSQGSFRLGTAIRPKDKEEYDLDMGCNLRHGLTKENISQKQLKEIVGYELELYREARNIKESLSEKRRCWRLEYADVLSFHMDVVPCIPEGYHQREILKGRMMRSTRLDESLASSISELAVSITDNKDARYSIITSDWRISNPEGYALWFEARMRTAELYLSQREAVFKMSIDNLPYYRWKTPLQGAIQFLKRHRDTMFKYDEESKPVSVIITTLAAAAYRGESDIISALENILNTMDKFINQAIPYVPNPVNPEEDFADKWYSEEHTHLRLKDNFLRWLIQARSDFEAICSNSSQYILDAANRGLSINLDKISVEQMLGIASGVAPAIHKIKPSSPRPWLKL